VKFDSFRLTSRLLRFKDTTRIMSPEMRPKRFGTFEKRAPAYRHHLSRQILRHFVWFWRTSGRVQCFRKNESQSAIQRIFPESFFSSSVRTKTQGKDSLTNVTLCMRTAMNTSFKESKLALSWLEGKRIRRLAGYIFCGRLLTWGVGS